MIYQRSAWALAWVERLRNLSLKGLQPRLCHGNGAQQPGQQRHQPGWHPAPSHPEPACDPASTRLLASMETSLAVLDGMRLSDWWESRGLSRSTAWRLVAMAQVQPSKARAAGSRAPVAFLSEAQVLVLDQLADQLRNGATMAQLERSALAAPSHPEPASDDGGATAGATAAPTPEALLTRLQALQLAAATGAPLSTAEVSWLLGARPGAAVVTRGRVIAHRQGRNCWSLSTDPEQS